MTNLLRPPSVSLRQLTRHRGGQLTGELSEMPLMGRVYADAADEGLTVVSHHTGREVVYVTEDYHFEGFGSDRELAWIDLLPASLVDRRHLPPIRLYND